MPRPINRLAAVTVTKEKRPGYYADGGGLYLVIDAAGGRRWSFIFQWRGKRTEMGMGPVADVSLAEARTARDTARKHLVNGRNPIEERKRAKAGDVPTFGELADKLLDEWKVAWRNEKHRGQWETSLQQHAAPIRGQRVHLVATEDVLSVLKPIWTRIPETASRTRGRIERVLDAARAAGHILPPWENPARWKGHLAVLLSKRQRLTRGRHPAMPWADVPAFMVQLRQREAMAARALEFTILTTARTGETLGARRREVDLASKLWTVPPERMKTNVEHRVPLAPAAVAVLEDVFRQPGDPDAFIFPGERKDRPLSNMAMTMVLRRMGVGHYSVHGFRSSFRDWAGDATSFPREVAEAALAHVVGEDVERAYRRGDALAKRRKLMEAWAGFLGRPGGGKVVAMARGAARRPGRS